ncbi:MAG: N-acetyltransferase family protein [Candidatus Baltobacteraceae bacterium]
MRPVLASDVGEILGLFEAVAAEERWIATEAGFDRARYTEFIKAASRRTAMTVAFVAVNHKNKIIGEITAYRDPKDQQWSIGMLVHKVYRGRGVGSALLQRLVDWARGAGIDALHLEVFPHNEAALALYRRFEFVQTAYHKNRLTRKNGEQWDTIEMALALA